MKKRNSEYVDLLSAKVSNSTPTQLKVKHRLAIETQKREDLREVYREEAKDAKRKAKASLLKRKEFAHVHRRMLSIGSEPDESRQQQRRRRNARRRSFKKKKPSSFLPEVGPGRNGGHAEQPATVIPSSQRRKEYLPPTNKSEGAQWAQWHRRHRESYSSSSVKFIERMSEAVAEHSTTPGERLNSILSIVQNLAEAPGYYGSILKSVFREVQRAAFVDFSDSAFTNAALEAVAKHGRLPNGALPQPSKHLRNGVLQPFDSLYETDCDSIQLLIQKALVRLRFYLQQKEFKELDAGRCLRQVVFTAWRQYTQKMQYEYRQRFRKGKLKIWFRAMKNRLLSEQKTSARAKMTQLTRTVTQVRKKQKMLRSKVLWDDVTIGRHHHFDNPETEWTLEDEEPPENSERANKENSATTADTSEVAHSRDSCVALRAVALQKGIDKTVRAVLRFLDKLLKEYAQALCDERGGKTEVQIEDLVSAFKQCRLNDLNSFQVWVRHYDPSMKDKQPNGCQTGAESTQSSSTQGHLVLIGEGPPLDMGVTAGSKGTCGAALTPTDGLLQFHVPLSEAQILGRNVRVTNVRRPMSGASDLSSGSAGSASTATSNLTASSVASAKTLEGGDLMNITSLRLFVADIFAFKASSDAAQDLAGGPRQTLPRLVSAYFLGLQPTTDADGRESRMELAARSLRLRRLFENSVLQYGRRKNSNYDIRCFGQMANIVAGPAFGPPACDLFLHMLRFHDSANDRTMSSPDIDFTLHESLRGIAIGRLSWTREQTQKRFDFAFRRYFLLDDDAKRAWQKQCVDRVNQMFYHNEDEENSVEDTEPIAEVPAKDVILLFSDLWSEVYTTKIAATQQALRDCSGKLWTDPAALTELCRDTLQILAPDMDYVDKSVTESKASQQSRGRRKTPAIASTFDVDDDQDVIETEAKKLALRIAASDRVFSYAHVLHLVSGRVVPLRHHQRQRWQRRHRLRFSLSTSAAEELDDTALEELLVSSGNDGAGTVFKRCRLVLFDTFVAYQCFGEYMDHSIYTAPAAVSALSLSEEESAQSDTDAVELGPASDDEDEERIPVRLLDEALVSLHADGPKILAGLQKVSARADERAAPELSGQTKQKAAELAMYDATAIPNALRRCRRRLRRARRRSTAQKAYAAAQAHRAKEIHQEKLSARMPLGRLLKLLRETGLMAPEIDAEPPAHTASESHASVPSVDEEADDDFLSEEALVRIIQLVSNEAQSEGEAFGEPGIVRKVAGEHNHTLSVSLMDFYCLTLYLALHVYRCTVRELVGRMLRFHAQHFPDFHSPDPAIRKLKGDASNAAAQRAWHQAVRRAALKSSAAHVVQDAKLARRTLKAQAAANQAEFMRERNKRRTLRTPFEYMGLGHIFCGPAYSRLVDGPTNQAALFDPQELKLSNHDSDNASMGTEMEERSTTSKSQSQNSNPDVLLLRLHVGWFDRLWPAWRRNPMPLLLRLQSVFHRHGYTTSSLDREIESVENEHLDAAVDLWSMNEDEKRLRSARSLHRLEVAAAHGAAVIAAQDVAKSAAQAAEEAEAKAAAAEALVRSSQEKDGAVPNKLAQQRAQALRAEAEELATAAEHAAVAQAEATAAAGVAARLRAQNEEHPHIAVTELRRHVMHIGRSHSVNLHVLMDLVHEEVAEQSILSKFVSKDDD